MRMDRYSDAAPSGKRKNPEKQRQEEEAWAIQTGRYVTLDEYLTREAVTYPTVPGNQGDVNQRYSLVRLHGGTFATLARNMNCFHPHDEQTRIVGMYRTQEQIREALRGFSEMKQAALYGYACRDRDGELER
jgi:hypothetical protein